MALSDSQRAALRARAAGLLTELRVQTTRRDNAVITASNDNEDLRLIREVAKLERQVEDRARQADKAEEAGVTAEDAAALLEELIGAQTPVVEEKETETEKLPEPELLPALPTEPEPAPEAKPKSAEPKSVATRTNKGGATAPASSEGGK